MIATAFHPELTGDRRVHALLRDLAATLDRETPGRQARDAGVTE